MPSRILVIGAHPDDEIFGAGGSLAKWAAQGATIKTILYSYGHMSHPHLKEEVIAATRATEAVNADKIIGGHGVTCLALKEGRFIKEFDSVKEKIEKLVLELSPDLVLTHASDDPHNDHREVLKSFLSLYDDRSWTFPVCTFQVWGFVSLRPNRLPKYVVDISSTFETKISALKAFSSQLSPLSYVLLNHVLFVVTHLRDFFNGMRYGHRFAEVFYKIR